MEKMKQEITREEVESAVREYIVSNFLFGNTSREIGYSDSFMENGIIDSTGILELIEYVETAFGISIGDDELLPENLDSLENISGFIVMKKEDR